MRDFTFRPARREGASLIIGLAGGTGSGKTYSAMRLAVGLAGEKKFCVIDTEAGRATHYADDRRFCFADGSPRFDHGDLRPPFRPWRYLEAVKAGEAAGYPVIVIDSISHVWAGEGGCRDWFEDELNRMVPDPTDWKKRKACTGAAWIAPKAGPEGHKRMVSAMLQLRGPHLILCFRAEDKIAFEKDQDGKMQITRKEGPTGLNGRFPICEKDLPYELTASFMLLAEHPGIPQPIKLQEQHRALFPAGQPIDEDAGRKLAAWAAGAAAPTPSAPIQRTGQAVLDRLQSLYGVDPERAAAAVGCRPDTLDAVSVARLVTLGTDVKLERMTIEQAFPRIEVPA